MPYVAGMLRASAAMADDADGAGFGDADAVGEELAVADLVGLGEVAGLVGPVGDAVARALADAVVLADGDALAEREGEALGLGMGDRLGDGEGVAAAA